MEQTKTQMELTIEELVALINSQKGDFLITVQYGEEANKEDYLKELEMEE